MMILVLYQHQFLSSSFPKKIQTWFTNLLHYLVTRQLGQNVPTPAPEEGLSHSKDDASFRMAGTGRSF